MSKFDNKSCLGNLEFLVVCVMILHDKKLNATERLLMATILGLHWVGGYGCYASNAYLGTVVNLSNSRVSALLTQLSKKGYIKVHMERDAYTGKVIKRYIEPLSFEEDYEELMADNFQPYT